jgi:hypothetical protein
LIRGGGTEVGCLGVMEKREKWRGTCTERGRNEKGRWNSNLKIGHMRVQLACDRSYVGVFSRIRVEGECVQWALCSNVQGAFNACMQECVCVMGRYGRTNASEFERSSVSTFERKGCVQT